LPRRPPRPWSWALRSGAARRRGMGDIADKVVQNVTKDITNPVQPRG
jgi:hypothetical protein